MEKRTLLISIISILVVCCICSCDTECGSECITKYGSVPLGKKADLPKYTITYNAGSYATSPEPIQVTKNHNIESKDLPILSANEEEYCFVGWFIEETKVTLGSKITSDTTFKAKWVKVSLSIESDKTELIRNNDSMKTAELTSTISVDNVTDGQYYWYWADNIEGVGAALYKTSTTNKVSLHCTDTAFNSIDESTIYIICVVKDLNGQIVNKSNIIDLFIYNTTPISLPSEEPVDPSMVCSSSTKFAYVNETIIIDGLLINIKNGGNSKVTWSVSKDGSAPENIPGYTDVEFVNHDCQLTYTITSPGSYKFTVHAYCTTDDTWIVQDGSYTITAVPKWDLE